MNEIQHEKEILRQLRGVLPLAKLHERSEIETIIRRHEAALKQLISMKRAAGGIVIRLK